MGKGLAQTPKKRMVRVSVGEIMVVGKGSYNKRLALPELGRSSNVYCVVDLYRLFCLRRIHVVPICIACWLLE